MILLITKFDFVYHLFISQEVSRSSDSGGICCEDEVYAVKAYGGLVVLVIPVALLVSNDSVKGVSSCETLLAVR